MTLLNVDTEKCKQDGLCAGDCPAGVIYFKPGQYPELKRGAEAMCLRCGHCVAICPHGAMDHAEVALADCPPIDPALAITKDQAVQFLRSRRSVRRFKADPVEKADLQRLIEIGRYAPTASNAQVLRWLVINDKGRLDTIAGKVIDWMRGLVAGSGEGLLPYMPAVVNAWDKGFNSIFQTASCLVVAMAPAGSRNGMVDLTLALSYLELAAPQFGMGTCWAGILQHAMESSPAIKAEVGIPADVPYHYPMMIGYSKVRYYRLPERKPPVITWA
ncbi:nitroreductase family protein [Desulfosarcina ovata]|uniref:Nitroreductase n=2 Tax=Desulfosarcina ovata TaxID=83564 RepID=A0A5K8AJM4_9BACT|nr:nitroreductase family protein [Desulfosarcina ovata]BBO82522.1 nitroreductase [Desulfosarcina ovata subsp. sediminis]BBO92000.1 nitroreductase [Desulfosarcina ovata subsp. ovata]